MELLYYKELLGNIGDRSTYAILLDLSEILCNILDMCSAEDIDFCC